MHLWIASAFAGMQAWEAAKEEVAKALTLQPRQEQLRAVLHGLCTHGIELMKEGKALEALPYLDIALPASFQFLQYFRAVALLSLKRYAEAKEAIAAELAIQPDNQDVRNISATIDQCIAGQNHHEAGMPARTHDEEYPFSQWIDTISRAENRLYYRDQTEASLKYLVDTVKRERPSRIVELGTLSGLSLRTWLLAADRGDKDHGRRSLL